MIEVPLNRIRPNPEQPRQQFGEDAIEELAQSIRVHGVIEPVIVRRDGDEFVLVSGERRVMAAQRAGMSTVPAIVREAGREEMLELALIENLQREDLGPIDEARAYRRLQEEFGLTQDEVARRVGKSRVSITNTLRLLQLPAEVLNDVSRGTLSAGHARALLAITELEEQRRLWQRIRAEKLSVRDVEQAARRREKPGSARPRESVASSSDPHVRSIEDRLRQVFGTQVRIVQRGAGGKVEIEFYSREELERVLGLLGVLDPT